MGIYVFNTEYLLGLLAENREEVDFGIHLIPRAIERDRVFAYPFAAYWRDVGTVQAYWEAHMDLLGNKSTIPSLEGWGVRTNIEVGGQVGDYPPAAFSSTSRVSRSLISAGCTIEGTVENSVLSPGVVVKKGAVVRDSIIFHNCIIGRDAVIDLAILDKLVKVNRGARVGEGDGRDVANMLYPAHLSSGISLVGKEAILPAELVVGRNCIIRPWTGKEKFRNRRLADGETV